MNPTTASREHSPLRDLALYSLLAVLCVLAGGMYWIFMVCEPRERSCTPPPEGS